MCVDVIFLQHTPLCVPVTVSSSISSSAVTAGCLANISASVMLSLLFVFQPPLLRHAINWHVSGTMSMCSKTLHEINKLIELFACISKCY